MFLYFGQYFENLSIIYSLRMLNDCFFKFASSSFGCCPKLLIVFLFLCAACLLNVVVFIVNTSCWYFHFGIFLFFVFNILCLVFWVYWDLKLLPVQCIFCVAELWLLFKVFFSCNCPKHFICYCFFVKHTNCVWSVFIMNEK